MKLHYHVAAWILCLLPSFSHSEVIQGYDIGKSWDNATVYVPSNFFPKRVHTVTTEKPMPTVILMHGCGGIGEHEKRWAEHIKAQGFIVVLPDSLAIPNRPKNCDSTAHKVLSLVPVNDLRPAEIGYAMSKLKDAPWVDQKNIFLMGHSEGGMAAYLAPELGFRGVIISGFPCTIRGGVRAKTDTPVLAINWERDPWFERPDRRFRQCSETPLWQRRTGTSELILSGVGHATAYEPSARDAVAMFLKNLMK
jgi:dienelactone hydrolase